MKKRIFALEGQLANLIFRLEKGLDDIQNVIQTSEKEKEERSSAKLFAEDKIKQLEEAVAELVASSKKEVERLKQKMDLQDSEIQKLKELVPGFKSLKKAQENQASEIETQASEVERFKQKNRQLEERLTAVEEELEKRKSSALMGRTVRRAL